MKFLPAWVLLSHVLLKEGNDWPGAESALREIMRRDPHNAETRSNLELLLRQRRAEIPDKSPLDS